MGDTTFPLYSRSLLLTQQIQIIRQTRCFFGGLDDKTFEDLGRVVNLSLGITIEHMTTE